MSSHPLYEDACFAAGEHWKIWWQAECGKEAPSLQRHAACLLGAPQVVQALACVLVVWDVCCLRVNEFQHLLVKSTWMFPCVS